MGSKMLQDTTDYKDLTKPLTRYFYCVASHFIRVTCSFRSVKENIYETYN